MRNRRTQFAHGGRWRLLAAAILLGVASGAPSQAGRAAEGEGKPPNFIVIMADDLGAKELGCYGHREHRTPHLDALGRTGARFRTCYATPICHPTRFLIMTGQYGCHNGIYNFAGRRGGPKRTDPAENIANHVIFAQILKKKGYATGMAGKWQLTGRIPKLIHETGFDEYAMWAYKHNLPEGVEHGGGWEGKGKNKPCRYWHPSIVKNSKYLPTKPDDYGPDMFTDFVIDFARTHKERPFFIYYPMVLTHGPHYTTPQTTKSPADRFQHLRSNFKANVEYMDRLVGRIVVALDDMGIRDRTIIFFTADNGTGGDGKGRPTELGARVPMIVNCPGTVKAVGARDELVDLSDILPTLVDFAGAELPRDRPIDGRSFAPILRGEEGNPREWIFSYIADRRILRTERWLLEDNSPLHYGRLVDCGKSRDGSGYREVTHSTAPEVLAIKEKLNGILDGLPAPLLASEGKATEGKARPKRKRQQASTSDAVAAEKIKLLLMGGRGHDWRGFHAVLSGVLKKTGDFRLTLSDKLDDLTADKIKKFDVALFYGSGGNFTDPRQEKGLAGFVDGGGGLAGVHATDAFKKSDVYWKLMGGRFTGHGGGKFTLRIEDKDHPITAAMKDFEISDETYRNEYHPQARTHSLARIDRGEEQQSMVWVTRHSKGRIFNTTLGHGKAAWANPHFQRLVVRGLYWVAGRKPKDPSEAVRR